MLTSKISRKCSKNNIFGWKKGVYLALQQQLLPQNHTPPKALHFFDTQFRPFGETSKAKILHEAKKRALKGCSFRMQARQTEMEGSNFGGKICGG